MPDLEEPLWSRRLRAASQKNETFFREARKRDGRVIPYEAVAAEHEAINTTNSHKRGMPTGRGKMIGMYGTRVAVPQYRTTGVTASDRAATSRTTSAAIDRLRADGAAAKTDAQLKAKKTPRK